MQGKSGGKLYAHPFLQNFAKIPPEVDPGINLTSLKVALLFLLLLLGRSPLSAQSDRSTTTGPKLSFTITCSNQGRATNELYRYTLRDLTTIRIGEISGGYSLNQNLSLGLGLFRSLGNPAAGFYDATGAFFPLRRGPGAYSLDYALLGLIMTNPTPDLPVFVQFGAGRTFGSDAWAFTGQLGGRWPVFRRLHLTTGVCLSYVAHRIPSWSKDLNTFGAWRLRFGLTWSGKRDGED